MQECRSAGVQEGRLAAGQQGGRAPAHQARRGEDLARSRCLLQSARMGFGIWAGPIKVIPEKPERQNKEHNPLQLREARKTSRRLCLFQETQLRFVFLAWTDQKLIRGCSPPQGKNSCWRLPVTLHDGNGNNLIRRRGCQSRRCQGGEVEGREGVVPGRALVGQVFCFFVGGGSPIITHTNYTFWVGLGTEFGGTS